MLPFENQKLIVVSPINIRVNKIKIYHTVLEKHKIKFKKKKREK